MESNYLSVPQADVVIPLPQPGLLLRNVHSLYRAYFRRWFGITAPTSLLAGLVLVLTDMKVRAIFRSFSIAWMQSHQAEIALAGILRYSSFFLSWLLGCFALAAIASVVNYSEAVDDGEVWRHDSYERARLHMGTIVLAALVTFGAFLAGMAAIEFVPFAIVRIVGWSRFSRFNDPVWILCYVLIASVVSWLGVTIPLILDGNIRLRAALSKSVKLCDGYEGALFLLILESVLGGLVAWYVTLHGLRFLVPDHLRYAAWYGWLTNLVGVLASAAVDPRLFIGLSLLAKPELLTPSSFPGSQQSADVY